MEIITYLQILNALKWHQYNCCRSVSKSCWLFSTHGLQHAGHDEQHSLFITTPRACSNSCPLSLWCHPTISSSVSPPSPPALNLSQHQSFPVNELFAPGCQSTGASDLPVNIQGWFPLELTDRVAFKIRNSWSEIHSGLLRFWTVLNLHTFCCVYPWAYLFFHIVDSLH